MKVQFSVCAQSVSIDQLTSRLSIFNVLDQITVPAFPVFISELTFVALLRREHEEETEQFKCQLSVMQNGKQGATADSAVRFGGASVARLIFNFSGLAIQSPGDVDFNLTLPSGEVHTLAIPINQVSLAAGPDTQNSPAEPQAKA
jgi:hypothetical protein